jgi:hypothetical protein
MNQAPLLAHAATASLYILEQLLAVHTRRLRGQIGYRRPMRFRVVASTPARGHAGAVLAGGGQRTREEGCWPEERQDPLGRRDIYMFAISWPNSRMPESRGTTAWTREGIMSYQLFSIECDYSTQ